MLTALRPLISADGGVGDMKVFREVSGSKYHYYVEVDQITTLWYPEKVWMHRLVEEPKGRLLAKGETNEVIEELRQELPADLLADIRRYWAVEGNSLTDQ